MKRKHHRTAFTLTELLIVLIIIGVLAVLALPILVKTIEKAKISEAISNLNLIRTGQKIYFLEYSTFAPSISDLNIEDPNTPSARYFDYTIQAATSADFTARAERKNDAPSPYKDFYYDIQKDGDVEYLPDPGNTFR